MAGRGPSRSPEGLVADRSKLTAMISSEVQRTLVKSPPELWAEISDPESLARHLGEFGEIRITRVQPEQKVEWEGDRASGTVVIKPSGWGTKVKLTVTRERVLESDDAPALDGSDSPGAALAAEPQGRDPHAQTVTPPEVERPDVEPPARQSLPEMGAAAPEVGRVPQPESATEVESVPELDTPSDVEAAPALEPAPSDSRSEGETDLSAEPVARRGFFARLFGRRRGIAPQPPAEPAPQAHRDDPQAPITEERDLEEPVADEPIAEEPIAETLSAEPPIVEEPTSDVLAADDLPADGLPADGLPADELTRDDAADEPSADDEAAGFDPEASEAAEEVTAEQVEAVLTGVLDRLGAAHHRPFSRS
jgi:hypothetical protein